MSLEEALIVSKVTHMLDGWKYGLRDVYWKDIPTVGAKIPYYQDGRRFDYPALWPWRGEMVYPEDKLIIATVDREFVVVHADTLKPICKLMCTESHKVLGRDDWEPL